MKSIVQIENLSKYYAGKRVLNNVSFNVFEDEILVIMGPSGVGKSTLLNLIGQLDSKYEGRIAYDPVVFEGHQVPFPFVFQASESLLPWLNVEDNIKLVKKDLSEEALNDVLAQVELLEHRTKMPHALSGGMKQRVGIARALVCHSKLLLMDEPFSSLDADLRKKLQDLMIQIKKERLLTIIFVTHDIEEANRIGTRIITLESAK